MENALGKASGQVERANGTVRRLEAENAKLRLEMEVAKLHAAESAAGCQEASKKEKKTLMKFQSWEKQKALFQEELVAEKRKLAQLLLEQEQAKDLREQLEVCSRRVGNFFFYSFCIVPGKKFVYSCLIFNMVYLRINRVGRGEGSSLNFVYSKICIYLKRIYSCESC